MRDGKAIDSGFNGVVSLSLESKNNMRVLQFTNKRNMHQRVKDCTLKSGCKYKAVELSKYIGSGNIA